MSTPNSSPALARRLSTGDAVMIGLGSMIGAGIFAAFVPAAAAAGSGLLIGLALAALIAYCNATSSAQLAAQYPTSGGTYVYGRERLGAWPGFVAGWGFVIGKTASCAAMAMTFAAYAVPESWQRPAAVAAVLALAAINTRGVTRTAAATRVIVTVVLLVLAMVVLAGLTSGAPALDGVGSLRRGDGGWMAGGWYGVLQSAGLLFFAFAGYARIATMGEEVREPRRTIPRAILTALGLALAVYVLIAVALLVTVGAAGVAASPTPLTEVLRVRGWEWGVPLVRIGAAAAALGALLALIAGIGRTSLAMARQGDLPALAGRRAPAPPGAPPRRDRPGPRGQRAGADGRPARGDRLLLGRRAAVLPDREPRRPHPGGAGPPVREGVAGARRDRLRGAGGDPAARLDRGGRGDVRPRRRLPTAAAPSRPLTPATPTGRGTSAHG